MLNSFISQCHRYRRCHEITIENVETDCSSQALACLQLVLEHWAQEDSARMTSVGGDARTSRLQPRKASKTYSSIVVSCHEPSRIHSKALNKHFRERRDAPLSRLEPGRVVMQTWKAACPKYSYRYEGPVVVLHTTANCIHSKPSSPG